METTPTAEAGPAPESIMKHTQQSSMTGPGPRGGFTLVEVLLVIMIMGMMFVSVSQLMQSARRTRDTIHNYQEMQLAGPAVLEMMVRDMRGILTTNRPRAAWLEIMDRTVNGQDADRIDFVTTTDSLIVKSDNDGRTLRADINEVGYVLRPSPENDEFLEMYRREDFGVDEEPLRGGEYTFLTDQIKDCQIEIYTEDGPDADPLDEWGPRAADEEHQGLPAWIKISLTVELKPRIDRESMDFSGKDRRTVTYVRTFRFPEILRVEEGEIARLGMPSGGGTTPNADPNAAGAGGGTDPNDPTSASNTTTPTPTGPRNFDGVGKAGGGKNDR